MIAGYIAAVFIGVSLGLIGGGGSILTIPVLVYLFGLSPLQATGHSLFIVGATSLAGAFANYKRGNVHTVTAVYFSLSSTITVFLARRYLLPAIPTEVVTIGNFVVTKSLFTMLLLAVVMMFAAIKMVSTKSEEDITHRLESNITMIIISGIGVGLLTGLLGAGGGFLIIPILVFQFRLPMKQAIGTSLLIITINSLFGFLGDLFNEKVDWELLLSVSALSIFGVYIGSRLSEKIQGEKLKRGFGWFVLVMGIYIVIKSLS